jgi:hypothetical protein
MHPSYFPVFLWSLVIFASFIGYGETLRRALRRPEFDDLGWGLTAAWGMATVLAIGGLLMALRLAVAPVLAVVVITGGVLAFFHGAKLFITNPGSLRLPRMPLSDVVLYGLAAIAFASSIAWPHQIDPNDDLVCYLMLPVKLLATGTLIEPFSFQRAGTFGGQAILQALVMIVGAERNGHVPDRGIAMVMIFGMLVHATRGLTGQQAFVRFLLLFAFWFVPVPRISTNGAMTGGAMLLGMLVTLDRVVAAKPSGWTRFLPAGLLLAGACSIRPTFAVTAACILAACSLRGLFAGQQLGAGVVARLRPYVVTGLFALAVLIPFMAVLYQSNGTPMVPPISGYVSKAYQTYAFQEPAKSAASALAFFTEPQGLCMLALLCLAALLPGHAVATPIVWGALVASLVILYRFSALAFLDLYRYLYPVMFPVGLWLLCEALQKSDTFEESKQDAVRPPIAAMAATLFLLLVINVGQGGKELREQIVGLPDEMKTVQPFFDQSLKKAYDELQGLVPAGETILTMVDAGYWLDYRRNPMYSINAVGGSSPPPGLPFEKGPEALASYLKSLGIRYVLAVDFNNAVLLYTRKLWNESTRPEWFYSEIWKPRFNDFMDNIDALAERQGGLVAKAGNARLIDLGE